ncbi:ScbR family autoregulator-binding transcription factor [Streptomyces sp. NPDC058268]|uniref:ScbR family autoregulator-binding transcription factor n=1 Tax=Streptomyces sp. NPDC058268 TaxID=3346413 RepID=UPI0036E78A96
MVKQERALRTRRSLIRAAAEVFAEEGYAPASLTTISKRAGVSNGALHFHFASKQALARAVEEEASESLRRITGPVAEAEGGMLQVLVDATYGLMNRLAGDVVVRAGFELGGDRCRGGADSRLRRDWQQWVEEALRRVQREGRLAEGVSPDTAAAVIVAVTVGFEVLGAGNPGWLTERSFGGFWELLLPGLAQEPGQVSACPGEGLGGGPGGGLDGGRPGF